MKSIGCRPKYGISTWREEKIYKLRCIRIDPTWIGKIWKLVLSGRNYPM